MAGHTSAANIQAVRNALAQMYAPTANNDVVKRCEEQLLAFKNQLSPHDSVNGARMLLAPILTDLPIQDSEVLYALQLVSERILQVPPWLDHPEDVRAAVRQLAVELVMHTNPKKYSKMIQEKAAHLVVALAIREWPQHWPNFLDELMGGSLPPQIVCVILRLLSEEIHEFSGFIASARKAELIQSMDAGVKQMLAYITMSMENFANTQDTNGLSAAIAVIEAFMAWAPPVALFDQGIPDACIKLLTVPQHAVAALAALQALIKRRYISRVDMEPSHPGYRKHVFPALVEYSNKYLKSILLLSYAPPMGFISDSTAAFQQATFQEPVSNLTEIDTEMHEYTIKFVTMLAKLGSSSFLSSFVMPRADNEPLTPAEQQAATMYIEIMLATIASPSVLIRNAGLSFFSSLFASLHRTLHRAIKNNMRDARAPNLAGQTNELVAALKTPFVGDLFFKLVQRFVSTASLSLVRWPNDPLLEAYAEEDFNGDTVALNVQWNQFKSRAAQIISLATKLEPITIMNVVLERLVNLLSKVNAIPWPAGQPAVENGYTSITTGKMPFTAGFVTVEESDRIWMFGNFTPSHSKVVVAALDGAVLACEAVLAMLTNLNFFRTNPEAQKPVENLFQTFLCLSQPNLQPAKVASLRMFIPLYRTNKSALEHCLRCLTEIIESSKGSTLCFRACTSLAALCRRLQKSKSTILVDFLNPLSQFALRAQEETVYFPAERSLIFDSAIAVALLVKDAAQQTSAIESLMTPLMNSLEVSGITRSIGNPQALFDYLDSAPQKDNALAVLGCMENAMSQIVRVNRNADGQEAIQTPLTQSIAPRAVTFGVMLVNTCHAMYNPNLFALTDEKRKSALEPTSREVATLLNISDENKTALWINPVSHGNDEEQSSEEASKTALQRADDLLARLGIQVPNPTYGQLRENIKKIRIFGYEILRCSILSGVSMSAQHLQQMLEAICSNIQFLEPIHVQYLIATVVRPLLSHQVTQANSAYLTMVANSKLPELITHVQRMVEMSNSGADAAGSSSLFALEVSREHGRKILAKTAADLLSGMFPRELKKGVEHVPAVFSHQSLYQCLHSLWDVLCSPVTNVTDYSSARTALGLVSRAVEQAPDNAKQMYASKLRLCLETAFKTDGMGSDSAHEAALGAVLAFFRKWPAESSSTVMELIQGTPDEFRNTIESKLKDMAAYMSTSASGVNRKLTRSKVRSIVRTLAKKAGTSHRKEVRVDNLPTKPIRMRRRIPTRNEEAVLPEKMIDSLFGGGDPL